MCGYSSLKSQHHLTIGCTEVQLEELPAEADPCLGPQQLEFDVCGNRQATNLLNHECKWHASQFGNHFQATQETTWLWQCKGAVSWPCMNCMVANIWPAKSAAAEVHMAPCCAAGSLLSPKLPVPAASVQPCTDVARLHSHCMLIMQTWLPTSHFCTRS